MIRSVYLHGAIGREFGREWRLDIVSPAEAVRALCTLRPAIEKALKAGFWRVIVGPPRLRNAIELELIHMDAGEQDIHIVPATPPKGGDDTVANVGKVIVGVALTVASFWMGGAAGIAYFSAWGLSAAGTTMAASMVMSVGLALTFGGIAGLLTPRLAAAGAATDMARPEDRPSFLFNGAVNNSIQGSPVPVVMGTHLVGSILISASIYVEDITP
jgi:predicted phage tail protein